MSSHDARGRLVDAIQDRTARVAVIGQGYVGLVDSRNATWGIPAPNGRIVRL